MMTAWAGDHPRTALLAGMAGVGIILFYGLRLNGFAHLSESLSRWRMEVLGGTFVVERSIQVPDVVLSFKHEPFDRLDALSGSSGFMGGAAFRQEFSMIAGRPGAKIRLVALDPRMGVPGHPLYDRFVAAAEACGLKPWEYAARCRHAVAVLLHLSEDFSPLLEARLLDGPLSSAPPPHFTPGRSVQLYRADESRIRLDILVPRAADTDDIDTFALPGLIIRHRPEAPEVKRFSSVFEEAWSAAKPLEGTLKEELLKSLNPVP